MAQVKPQQELVADAVEDVEQATPVTNQALIDLLTSWIEDDDEESIAEQRETLEYLMRALDEHRLPGCKLFS